METLITTVTDGQKKQVKRFAEDAVDRAIAEGLLDKDGIQKLIENGDKFQARIIIGIKELSLYNQFAHEEVESSYAYPKEYKGPKPIADQIKVITKIFDLDPAGAPEYARTCRSCPTALKDGSPFQGVEDRPTYGERPEGARDDRRSGSSTTT